MLCKQNLINTRVCAYRYYMKVLCSLKLYIAPAWGQMTYKVETLRGPNQDLTQNESGQLQTLLS